MTLVPLYAEPGICKVNSAYASGHTSAGVRDRAASGRFIDGDKVRFIAGFPEKIGGWVKAISTQMTDPPRAMTDWRDSSANPRLAIGTQTHLYYFDGSAIVDITPMRSISTGTLGADPFTTTSASTTINVTDASQNLANDDWVLLTGASTFNGVTVNGWYQVSNRSGAGYDIEYPTEASGTGAGGGAAVQFSYPRVTLSNPFDTTSGSSVVTVNHTSHGASTGDYVTFAGASAVAGLTLNHEYQLTVVNANSYTINAGSNANATVTGGGGSVSVFYDISIGQVTGLTTSTYGTGPYGVGPYGYTSTSTPTQFASWTLAAYGSELLASPTGGTIYIYDPVAGGRAYPVLNAPESCLAIFVTPERFLIALGIDGNYMQLAWPDQSDITNWTTLPSNTANSGRSLQGGTVFVGGGPVANGVSLFFSNRACFQAAYTGDNEVYNTPLLSDLAGLIGPQAMTTMGGTAYWMSDHDFWSWNGTVVQLPSDDIRDFVFNDINTQYQWKCVAGTNRQKKEVWFFYPSGSSTEINRYVIYHIDSGVFDIGTLERTAWRDSDLFIQPYGCDASGYLYAHEVGVNADGAAMEAYVQFAPMDVSSGNLNVDVFGFIPDFERIAGTVDLEINVQQYPMSAVTDFGPYEIPADGSNPLIDMRADGKMVGYTLTSNEVDGDFRLGLPRANVQPSGARL